MAIHQYQFIEGHSTNINTCQFSQSVHNVLNKRSQVDVIYTNIGCNAYKHIK